MVYRNCSNCSKNWKNTPNSFFYYFLIFFYFFEIFLSGVADDGSPHFLGRLDAYNFFNVGPGEPNKGRPPL